MKPIQHSTGWLGLAMACGIITFAVSVDAQSWTNRYNGTGNGWDEPYDIAVDGSGNAYVTGRSPGTNTGSATIAYSSAGVPRWTNLQISGTAIAVDGSDNVYVTGSSPGISGENDYMTVKYSNTGLPLWTNYCNGPGNHRDDPADITVDTNGNAYVTGSSYSYSTGWGYLTVAYTSAGTPLWTNGYNSAGVVWDQAVAVAVGRGGNVYVTGNSEQGAVTIAYTTAGVPLWTNRLNSGATTMAVDGDGNVYVTGTLLTWRANWDIPNYSTIAYTSAGVPIWTNRYQGPGTVEAEGRAIVNSIAVDSDGNVYVTGGVFVGFVAGGTDTDYATIAYSQAGTPLWTNHYSGPGNSSDMGWAIAVDADDNVYVTGNSTGIGSSDDYATIAYTGEGVALWTNRYNGPGNDRDQVSAITVDASGSVHVTGKSIGLGSYYDYATIKYAAAGPVLLETQRGAAHVVLSWANPACQLQSAPTVTGPFTNVPTATSPYTNSMTDPQQFFRLYSP